MNDADQFLILEYYLYIYIKELFISVIYQEVNCQVCWVKDENS